MWITGLLAVTVAVGAAWFIFLLLNDLSPTSANGQDDALDVIRTTLTIAAFIGAVLAGVYAYRKQRMAEGDASRADAEQLAHRYTTAAEQLGHEKPAVRLAGVYAMARLADDWPEQRQVCIDVLCAYIRIPYEADPASPRHIEGEREVRLTAIKAIRDHLQDPDATTSWCGHNFNFAGATFDGGDFTKIRFDSGKVAFSGAEFKGNVNFSGAEFSGGHVDFTRAKFISGKVKFSYAKFAGGDVNFSGAKLTGGSIDFFGSEFSGSNTLFLHVAFHAGTVDFFDAALTGGNVSFSNSKFTGGEVAFTNVEFSGGDLNFVHVKFGDARVDFSFSAISGGNIDFSGAEFDGGGVAFSEFTFNGGGVDFTDVKTNDCDFNFANAQFNGSKISWGPIDHP